jgi:hypothetical protein
MFLFMNEVATSLQDYTVFLWVVFGVGAIATALVWYFYTYKREGTNLVPVIMAMVIGTFIGVFALFVAFDNFYPTTDEVKGFILVSAVMIGFFGGGGILLIMTLIGARLDYREPVREDDDEEFPDPAVYHEYQ